MIKKIVIPKITNKLHEEIPGMVKFSLGLYSTPQFVEFIFGKIVEEDFFPKISQNNAV